MPSPSSELRLFGLDLPAVWQEIRQAWRKVLHMPALAWLGPRPAVLLQEAQGQAGLWKQHGAGLFVRRGESAQGARSAFRAVELPEDILLRRQLTLPALPPEQLARAVELEAQGNSPFAPADLAWGYAVTGASGAGPLRIELVLASRRSIAQHLARHAGGLEQPEVWVRCAQPAEGAFPLQGFGEGRRLRAERRGWMVLGCFVALSLALIAALAVTPTLQLRQRALQAVAASTQLAEQARPQVAKREALMAANEQVQALESLIGHRLNPLRTMHTLTQVLGDDTVLQRLQIEGSSVLIAGQTPDTAAMMQKLSAQPGFKGVRAPSAATRPAGATKETFQVEFTIDESSSLAGGTAAPAQQPASEAKP